MDWARILAYITGTVDQELLLRNEYLAAEKQLPGAEGGWGWFITLVPLKVLVPFIAPYEVTGDLIQKSATKELIGPPKMADIV